MQPYTEICIFNINYRFCHYLFESGKSTVLEKQTIVAIFN